MFLSPQVLENYSDAPMTPKQILQVIEAEGLKEMRLVLGISFKTVCMEGEEASYKALACFV